MYPYEKKKYYQYPENKDRTISIPAHLYEDFLDMLDSAQCQFTDDDLEEMSPTQVEVLNFIQALIGKTATKRFHTKQDQIKAIRNKQY